MGKTRLALNIAQHVGTKTGKTVGVFSLEMSQEQLFLRMLSSEAQIDGHALRTGFLRSDDWGRLTEALGVLGQAKVFIDDTAGDRRARDAGEVAPPGGRARPAPARSSTTSS